MCGQFVESGWHTLLAALQEAFRRSCVQVDSQKEFPTRAWAYVNGTLHEARITNQGLGEYHGFPLEYESQKPEDPHDLLKDAPRVDIATV